MKKNIKGKTDYQSRSLRKRRLKYKTSREQQRIAAADQSEEYRSKSTTGKILKAFRAFAERGLLQ